MHVVLLLFRPLPNVGIQNFDMWGMYNLGKAYRNIKKSIVNRRVEDWEASHGHTKYTTIPRPMTKPCGRDCFWPRFCYIFTFLWPISHPFYPNGKFCHMSDHNRQIRWLILSQSNLKGLNKFFFSVILDKNNLNIYVCSHLGCGTDSIFIGVTNNSETQKLCK